MTSADRDVCAQSGYSSVTLAHESATRMLLNSRGKVLQDSRRPVRHRSLQGTALLWKILNNSVEKTPFFKIWCNVGAHSSSGEGHVLVVAWFASVCVSTVSSALAVGAFWSAP